MTLRFHLAGLVVGLVTALVGMLATGRTEPTTVQIIDHATVLQCGR